MLRDKIKIGIAIAVAVSGLLTLSGFFFDVERLGLAEKILLSFAFILVCTIVYMDQKNKQKLVEILNKLFTKKRVKRICVAIMFFIMFLFSGDATLHKGKPTDSISVSIPLNTPFASETPTSASTTPMPDPTISTPVPPAATPAPETPMPVPVASSPNPKAEEIYNEGVACEIKGDDKNAFNHFVLAADYGNAKAQYKTGYYYHYGKGGIVPNEIFAFRYFQKAAEQGDPRGLLWMGWYYHYGVVVDQNYDLAYDYYLKARDQGHPQAQNRINDLRQVRGY